MIAESYERIHRSNLVGMGVVPLEYLPGDTAQSLGLTGRERYSIILPEQLVPRMLLQVKVSQPELWSLQEPGSRFHVSRLLRCVPCSASVLTAGRWQDIPGQDAV